VDIGAHCTHAVITDDNELRMSRTIETGGDLLTDLISAALEISREEAEVLKCQHGTGVTNDAPAALALSEESRKIAHIMNDILRDKLDFLATELAKLFRYFSAQNQGRRVEKVLLVGGGASLKHLNTLLAERLATDIEVDNPISRLTAQPVDLKNANEGSFAVAIGLALRDT
jgi:type IV pilus assembly protein PilM